MAQAKKYIVDYISVPTGYRWTREFDRLEDFEDVVKDARHDCTQFLSVYDCGLEKFVFRKYGMTWKIDIDMLSDSDRDFRTSTRKTKHS